MLNRILVLPCYISHEVEPMVLSGLDVQGDVLTLRALECICFYAKYTKYVEFVKRITPDGPGFIECLKKFISKSFKTNTVTDVRCNGYGSVIDDLDVLDDIRRAYELSRDKKEFTTRIIEFVNELK